MEYIINAHTQYLYTQTANQKSHFPFLTAYNSSSPHPMVPVKHQSLIMHTNNYLYVKYMQRGIQLPSSNLVWLNFFIRVRLRETTRHVRWRK